jgi:diguanylate cyclase (GGDEF)-like protein
MEAQSPDSPGPDSPGPAVGTDDAALRWRALGSLYLAGALIGAASLLLPHAPVARPGALWGNTAAAFMTAAGCWLLARRLPMWANHVCLAAGTLIVTLAVWESGDAESYYAIWYIWIPLYAFSFYGRRAACAHTAFVGLTYAAILQVESADRGAGRWLTTIATLAIAAIFVDTLVRELRRHAGSVEASANRLGAVARAMQRISRCVTRREVYAALRDAVAGAPQLRSVDVVETLPGAAPAGDLALPIAVDRPGVGVAAWLVADTHEELPDDVRQAVAMLVAEAANALTRIELMTRLESAAQTDELTGLRNRRAWDVELARALAQARRFGHPLCVALFDLDGFKELNDSHGHQAGDETLAAAARHWSGAVRDVDTLARWGGDEFALIVPGCDVATAGDVVERVRQATPGITCSAGLVSWNGREDEAALMGRVDATLYRAKRGGRDRLVIDGVAPSLA